MAFFNNLSGGEKVLLLTLIALGVLLLFVFGSWLVNDGNIFFARIFLKLPVTVPKLGSLTEPDSGSNEPVDASGNEAES